MPNIEPEHMAAAPYPADTRAKGWRFELHTEKVKGSDTWLRAKTGVMRGALLLLWMEAWEQTPCGSLPKDDELVALLLDMTPPAFAKAKPVLLRGWSICDDGRLYHAVITERVLVMLDKRANDAQRAANRRARIAESAVGDEGITDASRVTNGGVETESPPSSTPSTKHQAPTTSSPTSKKDARKRASSLPLPDGVSEQTWSDWLELRRKKSAPVTQTVVAGAAVEAQKAGMSLDAFLRIWCVRGSQGLQASWLRPEERPSAVPTESAYARSMREKYEIVAPELAARRPGADDPLTIEMEAPNAARALG